MFLSIPFMVGAAMFISAIAIGGFAYIRGAHNDAVHQGMLECAAAGDAELVDRLQSTVAAQNDAIAQGQQAVADAHQRANAAHAKLREIQSTAVEDGQCHPGCTLSLPAQ